MIIVVTSQLRQIAKALEEGDQKEAVRLVHELREEIDDKGLHITVRSDELDTIKAKLDNQLTRQREAQELQAKTIGELRSYLHEAKEQIRELEARLDERRGVIVEKAEPCKGCGSLPKWTEGLGGFGYLYCPQCHIWTNNKDYQTDAIKLWNDGRVQRKAI